MKTIKLIYLILSISGSLILVNSIIEINKLSKDTTYIESKTEEIKKIVTNYSTLPISNRINITKDNVIPVEKLNLIKRKKIINLYENNITVLEDIKQVLRNEEIIEPVYLLTRKEDILEEYPSKMPVWVIKYPESTNSKIYFIGTSARIEKKEKAMSDSYRLALEEVLKFIGIKMDYLLESEIIINENDEEICNVSKKVQSQVIKNVLIENLIEKKEIYYRKIKEGTNAFYECHTLLEFDSESLEKAMKQSFNNMITTLNNEENDKEIEIKKLLVRGLLNNLNEFKRMTAEEFEIYNNKRKQYEVIDKKGKDEITYEIFLAEKLILNNDLTNAIKLLTNAARMLVKKTNDLYFTIETKEYFDDPVETILKKRLRKSDIYFERNEIIYSALSLINTLDYILLNKDELLKINPLTNYLVEIDNRMDRYFSNNQVKKYDSYFIEKNRIVFTNEGKGNYSVFFSRWGKQILLSKKNSRTGNVYSLYYDNKIFYNYIDYFNKDDEREYIFIDNRNLKNETSLLPIAYANIEIDTFQKNAEVYYTYDKIKTNIFVGYTKENLPLLLRCDDDITNIKLYIKKKGFNPVDEIVAVDDKSLFYNLENKHLPSRISSINLKNVFMNSALIEWNKVDNINYYKLYIREAESADYNVISNIKNNSYFVNDLSPEKKYYLKITTVEEDGESEFSKEFEFYTLPVPVKHPYLVKSTSSNLTISWENHENIDGYKIYKFDENSRSFVILTNLKTNYFLCSDLDEDTSYNFKITTYNRSGESIMSETFEFKTLIFLDNIKEMSKNDFVMVPASKYVQEFQNNNEKKTTIKQEVYPFYLGRYEVTYELWYVVLDWALKNNYKFENPGKEGNSGVVGAYPTRAKYKPVTSISIKDAIVWCNAFSEMMNLEPVYTYRKKVVRDSTEDFAFLSLEMDLNKNGYRLPLDFEWELAARYITTNKFQAWNYISGDNSDIPRTSKEGLYYAWYNINSGGTVKTTGTRRANFLGLYDMSGNVGEFVIENNSSYKLLDTIIIRGGNIKSDFNTISMGRRVTTANLNFADSETGFRLARSVKNILQDDDYFKTTKFNTKTVKIGDYKLNFVLCPPGSFMMGSYIYHSGRKDDEVMHRVKFTNGFWISEAEISQELFQYVMKYNPSKFVNPKKPVDSVSWYEAIEFCNKLSSLLKLTNAYIIKGDDVILDKTANGFRLPTEAEWEYACKAGTDTKFNTGIYLKNSTYNISNDSNVVVSTTSIKSYNPNNWGLYDMHGNVKEWCWDYYGNYKISFVSFAFTNILAMIYRNEFDIFESLIDPTGPTIGSNRVLRGGSWKDYELDLRSAKRFSEHPKIKEDPTIGFRIVMNLGD